MELTRGRGADVIYDGVGRDSFAHSVAALAVHGHLVSYGQASGDVGPFDIGSLAARSATVSRPNFAHFTDTPEKVAAITGRLFDALERRVLRAEIGGRYPLGKQPPPTGRSKPAKPSDRRSSSRRRPPGDDRDCPWTGPFPRGLRFGRLGLAPPFPAAPPCTRRGDRCVRGEEDDGMTDVRLGSLVAERHGAGPAVVLVHGLGGSSGSFELLMPALDGYCALRPDLPGAAARPFGPAAAGWRGSPAPCASACGRRARRAPTSSAIRWRAHLPAHRRGRAGGGGEPHPLRRPPRARAGRPRRPRGARPRSAHHRNGRDRGGGIRGEPRPRFSGRRGLRLRARERPSPEPGRLRGALRGALAAHAARHEAIRCPTLLVHGAGDAVAPLAAAKRCGTRSEGPGWRRCPASATGRCWRRRRARPSCSGSTSRPRGIDTIPSVSNANSSIDQGRASRILEESSLLTVEPSFPRGLPREGGVPARGGPGSTRSTGTRPRGPCSLECATCPVGRRCSLAEHRTGRTNHGGTTGPLEQPARKRHRQRRRRDHLHQRPHPRRHRRAPLRGRGDGGREPDPEHHPLGGRVPVEHQRRQRIDGRGATLMPGLVDAHLH